MKDYAVRFGFEVKDGFMHLVARYSSSNKKHSGTAVYDMNEMSVEGRLVSWEQLEGDNYIPIETDWFLEKYNWQYDVHEGRARLTKEEATLAERVLRAGERTEAFKKNEERMKKEESARLQNPDEFLAIEASWHTETK